MAGITRICDLNHRTVGILGRSRIRAASGEGVLSVMAFHEKAGRSQVDSFLVS
jgi:hypothetical protein